MTINDTRELRLGERPVSQSVIGGRFGGRTVVMLASIVAVLVFYIWCSASYGKQVRPGRDLHDFQNLQADAFLAGQLHLTLPVPEGLARLPDPYDPSANESYRAQGLHDLTFYGGRLYTYFGPAPVLLLHIPFRALGQGELPPALACLLFGFGGFLASVGVFRTITRRFLRPLSIAGESMAVLTLGLASPVGWLLHIGRAYEVSIATGYFLVFTGLYFLTRGLFGGVSHRTVHYATGSFFLAAAVGARPNLFWFFGFILFALAFLRWGAGDRRLSRSAVLALAAPYVVVAGVLAWYNWVRFGAVTEFGTTYMLLGENIRLARAKELEFLARGLFEYLLSPARARSEFPWIMLRPFSYPFPTETHYLREPVAGLLPNMPACLLGVIAFGARPVTQLRRKPWLVGFLALLTATALAIVALTSFHFHSVTMRYQLDYAPLLLLASVVGWFATVQQLPVSSHIHRVLQGAAVAVVVWSMIFSIAITAYPCAGTGSC